MSARWLATPLLLAAFAIGVACSSGDDDSGAEPTSPSDGSGTNGDSSGPPELGDFPIPVPEWADAVSVDDSGPLKVVLFTVPFDQQDATVAFYEDWTADQPDEFVRTDSGGGGVTFQSEAAVGEGKSIVAILSPLAGDDFVSVSLSFGEFE